MNSENPQNSLREMCASGRLYSMLNDYVASCIKPTPEDEEGACDKATKKRVPKRSAFPNLAGFCRYLGIGTGELDEIRNDYPLEYGRMLTVLEDEALNSEMSATLLSAYLKKRLGYDSSLQKESPEEALQISFEHDIFEDGE